MNFQKTTRFWCRFSLILGQKVFWNLLQLNSGLAILLVTLWRLLYLVLLQGSLLNPQENCPVGTFTHFVILKKYTICLVWFGLTFHMISPPTHTCTHTHKKKTALERGSLFWSSELQMSFNEAPRVIRFWIFTCSFCIRSFSCVNVCLYGFFYGCGIFFLKLRMRNAAENLITMFALRICCGWSFAFEVKRTLN